MQADRTGWSIEFLGPVGSRVWRVEVGRCRAPDGAQRRWTGQREGSLGCCLGEGWWREVSAGGPTGGPGSGTGSVLGQVAESRSCGAIRSDGAAARLFQPVWNRVMILSSTIDRIETGEFRL